MSAIAHRHGRRHARRRRSTQLLHDYFPWRRGRESNSAPRWASSDKPASAARCSAPKRPSVPALSRSATTSSPGSPKRNARDGSARSKGSASASLARRRSSASWTPRIDGGRSSWTSAYSPSDRSPPGSVKSRRHNGMARTRHHRPCTSALTRLDVLVRRLSEATRLRRHDSDLAQQSQRVHVLINWESEPLVLSEGKRVDLLPPFADSFRMGDEPRRPCEDDIFNAVSDGPVRFAIGDNELRLRGRHRWKAPELQ